MKRQQKAWQAAAAARQQQAALVVLLGHLLVLVRGVLMQQCLRRRWCGTHLRRSVCCGCCSSRLASWAWPGGWCWVPAGELCLVLERSVYAVGLQEGAAQHSTVPFPVCL